MIKNQCKVILLGESSVGKTSLIKRYLKDEFEEVIVSRVSEGYLEKIIDINWTPINLEIWDTAGEERFRTLVRNYFKGTHAAILIYDISKRTTCEEIKKYWYNEIKENCPNISMNFNNLFLLYYSFGNCGK